MNNNAYNINIFSGGAELLFDNKRHYNIDLPNKDTWKLGDLLIWLRDNLLSERPELFIQNNSVRPGILVLVNDSDWELMVSSDLWYLICSLCQILCKYAPCP
ncbi:rurm1 protein [Holotrichia oblita]|uniref:Rurm1 protein n=1 Tax=Holotrichia oblita TaxID=644536 RepID=A0ACB9TU89_HOLOL|nr:rurm1 protein [Holotrichia oblita]